MRLLPLFLSILVACSSPAPEAEPTAEATPEEENVVEEQQLTVEAPKTASVFTDIIEEMVVDLNGDEEPDKLTIGNSLPEDPGEFSTVQVTIGEEEFTFENEDGWDLVDPEQFYGWENRVPTDYAFLLGTRQQWFLFLTGYHYGCCAPKLTVIDLAQSPPAVVWNEEFLLYTAKYIGIGDDTLGIYGRKAAYEPHDKIDGVEGDIGSYSPYHVYRLTGGLALDSNETAAFNREVYLWEGFEYNAEMKVVYPPEGNAYKLD